MKKVTAIIAVLALAICCLTVVGCGGAQDKGVSVALNERYIQYFSADEPAEEQTYFIFVSETEGEYHRRDGVYDYILHFRYEIVGDTLYGFYHSVEFGDKHTPEKKVFTRWKLECVPSENFLIQSGASEPWFNADYLKNTIPDYASGEKS